MIEHPRITRYLLLGLILVAGCYEDAEEPTPSPSPAVCDEVIVPVEDIRAAGQP